MESERTSHEPNPIRSEDRVRSQNPNLSGGGNNLVASTAYTYDSANRLTSLANTLPGTGGPTYSPTYDVAGRVIQFAADGGSSDFAYDNDNQLTAVTTTTAYSTNSVPAESFSFTPNANPRTPAPSTSDSSPNAPATNNQTTVVAAWYRRPEG